MQEKNAQCLTFHQSYGPLHLLDISDDSFIAAVLERSKREEEAYAQLEVHISRLGERAVICIRQFL